MAVSAAVVDPVGRNANWSVKEREGGGARIAGSTETVNTFNNTFCVQVSYRGQR